MMLLSVAALKDLQLYQMNAITDVLNRDSDEQVFMEQPLGCEQGNPAEWAYCFKKVFHVLKQASRKWYVNNDSLLTDSLAFTRSSPDDCFYVK